MSALSSSSMVDTNAVAMHACKNDGFGASGRRERARKRGNAGTSPVPLGPEET